MGYADDFKVYGPYYNGNHGRKLVIVVDKNGKRRTISYPKWLMECHLGRKLDPNKDTVDHFDGDINNNDFSNLRIVPRDEHSADDTRRAKNLNLHCAWCDKEFERSPRLIRDKAKKKKAGPFCSRQCAGKYSRMLQLKLIDKLGPQKHVDTEYYKRKHLNTKASFDFSEEVDIEFEDLLVFAEDHLEY